MVEREFPHEVANGLEWTFVSDQSLFDGASRDQLRQHFHAWATEAEKSEQPRVVDGKEYYVASRYQYFIQVDEEVLQATVDADPYNDFDCGWVNLVRCWDQDLDSNWREEAREHVDQEDGDEGWMDCWTYGWTRFLRGDWSKLGVLVCVLHTATGVEILLILHTTCHGVNHTRFPL